MTRRPARAGLFHVSAARAAPPERCKSASLRAGGNNTVGVRVPLPHQLLVLKTYGSFLTTRRAIRATGICHTRRRSKSFAPRPRNPRRVRVRAGGQLLARLAT